MTRQFWASSPMLLIALVAVSVTTTVRADLIGYWSADTTGGTGTALPNDQGNDLLDGELVGGAEYSASGSGHTGSAGDYAIDFPGEDADYAVIPATEEALEEFTITAWVNGVQMGDWAGIVISRAVGQPIGIDYHAFDGQLTYIWNDDSAQTWGFVSGLVIPEEEWTFVALTIHPDAATLYVGPKGSELESAANEIPHVEQINFHEWRLAEDDCCGPGRNFGGLIDDVSMWNQTLSEDDLAKLHSGAATPLTLFSDGPTGDFNNDAVLDAADIDLLATEVRAGTNTLSFDLNQDAKVDDADYQFWVKTLRKTWIGDANMDGLFSSADFVDVFQKGEYEDGVDNNSTWADGDWNGDGNFNSSDFVAAFQDGGYEQGTRPVISAVPEPSSMLPLLVACMTLFKGRRSRERSDHD
jgi:hypothetical protein